MREILFRGKRLNGDGWVYGDLSFHVHDGIPYVFPADGYDSADCYEVDPATVGQYTGLMDKNEKKIFEGDVVRNDEPGDPSEKYLTVFGVVRFGAYEENYSEHFGFFVEWKDNEDDDYSKTYTKGLHYWSKYEYFEAIGNIHDNPELLEALDETV